MSLTIDKVFISSSYDSPQKLPLPHARGLVTLGLEASRSIFICSIAGDHQPLRLGAWCWYKSIALLEEVGYTVTTVDLAGSGVHSFDFNDISSPKQYAKPLTKVYGALL
ncbi:hypothetical protein MLD38_033865 [Melastoma candidum]|uniref:Uncharacterized protein n=1 Tax=Melastoma candidum TaxID=119954 RepID=A0ACB9M8P0_9MYRT|nr:hypothetical protein MLD38_033865 [Melastoma candidum]